MIKNFELVDVWRKLHPESRHFTYRNTFHKMASRIDFWLVADCLCNYVRQACIKPVALCPDHCAVTFTLICENINRGRGYWKLNNSLIVNEEYKSVIKNMVNEMKDELKFEKDISYVWDMCKIKIKEYSIRFAKRLKTKENANIKILERKYEKLINSTDKGNNEKDIVELRRKIEQFYSKQCTGAQIRSRVQYYEEGETNMKYFKEIEKQNAVKKTITSLKIGRNSEHNMSKILQHVYKFYSKLYSSLNTNKCEVREYVQNIDGPKLKREEADACEGKISALEITQALKNMKRNKTPGGDGLTVEFYMEFWEDIQDLVLGSLNAGFEKGRLSYTQRHGIITLLYKKGDKEDIRNWRPITLLNVDYKLAAMVLANRLQKVLTSLINEDQVGYIKDWVL